MSMNKENKQENTDKQEEDETVPLATKKLFAILQKSRSHWLTDLKQQSTLTPGQLTIVAGEIAQARIFTEP